MQLFCLFTLDCTHCCRFIPEPIISLMKKNAGKSCLQIIDTAVENPELIWTSDMQGELRKGILSLHTGKGQGDEISELPADFSVEYAQLNQEVYIGGVYIRLFLKQPSFKLSNPVYFLEKLIENYETSFNLQVPPLDSASQTMAFSTGQTLATTHQELILGKEDFLSLLTSCIICLLKNEPSLFEQFIHWGSIDQIITNYLYRINSFQRKGIPLLSVARLLNELVNSSEIIENLAANIYVNSTNNIISNLTFALLEDDFSVNSTSFGDAMGLYREAIVIIEILKKIFQAYYSKGLIHFLVVAFQCQLPQLLVHRIVNVKNQRLFNEQVNNAMALRIHTIDLLKAMLLIDESPEIHRELKEILSQSKEWGDFKDQSHDLFITVSLRSSPLIFHLNLLLYLCFHRTRKRLMFISSKIPVTRNLLVC
jgi:hypothetical protein